MPEDSNHFQPDQESIDRALKLHKEILREGRFNDSEEARRKQDTPFADEVVDAGDASEQIDVPREVGPKRPSEDAE